MRSLYLSIFSAMLGLGIIAPLMPIYAKELGATTLILGLIYSSFSIARTTFTPIVGIASDRFGRKPFILMGLLSYSIISLLYILARNSEDLVIIRFFHGLSSAMVIPSAMAYVSQMAPKGEEGRTISSFNLAFLSGMGFGPFLGGVIKDIFGLKFAFFAMSILTALAFLTVAIFVPNVRDKSVFNFGIIFNKSIASLMVFRFSTAIRLALIIAFFPVLISHLKGYQIGSIISTIVLTNAISQKVFGGFVDRFDRVKLATFGSSISTVLFIALPFAGNFVSILALAIAMGIFNGLAMNSASAIAVSLGRIYGHGAVMGLFNTSMGLAMVVSPIMAGIIADFTNLVNSFVILGLVSLACLFIFYVLITVDEVRVCKREQEVR